MFCNLVGAAESSQSKTRTRYFAKTTANCSCLEEVRVNWHQAVFLRHILLDESRTPSDNFVAGSVTQMAQKPSYLVETGGRYSPKSRAESFQSWFATAEILLVQPKETACSCRWKTIHTISQSWLGYGISTSRVLYGVVYSPWPE